MILVLAAGIVVGLLAEWAAFEFRDPVDWVPDLAAGWTVIAAGVVAWRGRPESRVGALLVATGLTWFLGNFGAVEWTWLAWVGSQGIYAHRGPLVHALVTFPTGRSRSRPERAIVAVAYVAAVVTPMWRDEWLTIGLAAAVIAVTAWRPTRVVARERRARRTALLLAVAVGAALGIGAAGRLAFAGDAADDLSLLAYQAVLCVTAVGAAAGLLSQTWQHGDLTDLVVELGAARSDALRDSLAYTLGDPKLEVGYWSTQVDGFVDSTGRQLSMPGERDDRAATVVAGDGGPIAVLIHHQALLDDPALVESVGIAARLASVNARLQAELRAQIVELDASRRRLVTAGDDERRRLEGRLRAGAERRLTELTARIESARATVDDGSAKELLHALENEMAVTIEELRSLAAGLHPRVLTEAGLTRALELLAERCPVPVQLVSGVGRLPDPIEVAVYFVCSEALANVAKHAAATQVVLTVDASDGRITAEIRDDGIGGADVSAGTGLRDLKDRIEALGGTLEVSSTPHAGTRLAAELPFGGEAR